MPKETKKPDVNIARIVYDSYPDRDLLPLDPSTDVRSIRALFDAVTKRPIGDTLFQFLVIEIVEGGQSSLDGAIRVLKNAQRDVEAVLRGLYKVQVGVNQATGEQPEQALCDECGAIVPDDADSVMGTWHKDSCSCYYPRPPKSSNRAPEDVNLDGHMADRPAVAAPTNPLARQIHDLLYRDLDGPREFYNPDKFWDHQMMNALKDLIAKYIPRPKPQDPRPRRR